MKNMRRIVIEITCIAMLIVSSIGFASATDYFISTSGNNANDGLTIDTAWATPSYAAKKLIAGDTAYLLDGTWTNDDSVYFKNSGTEEKPIRMIAYSGTPTLDGVDKTGTGFDICNHDWIQVTGIKVVRYNHNFYVRGSHITIRDCESGHAGGSSLYACDRQSHYNLIDNCVVYVSGNNGIQLIGGMDRWGLSTDPSTHITISNCTIHDMYGHNPIDMYGNLEYIVIKDNVIYDSCYNGIYSHSGEDTQRHVTIDNNTIYDVVDGIELENVHDVNISNNLIYNVVNHGICVFGPSSDVTYYKNDIEGGEQGCFNVGYNQNHVMCENTLSGYDQYRIYYGSGAVRNAVDSSYYVASVAATLTTEYTNGQVFRCTDKIGNYKLSEIIYTDDRSYMNLETASGCKARVKIITYPFYLSPTQSSLSVSSVSNTDLKVDSDSVNNPTWISVSKSEYANNPVTMLVDGAPYETQTADSTGFVSFYYNDNWNIDHIFTWSATEVPPSANSPVLSLIGDKSVEEGSTLQFIIDATDEDGDSLTYSAMGLPDGATFDTSSRMFTWTPVKGQAGSYTVTFKANDGCLSDSEDVEITVIKLKSVLGVAYGTVTIDGDLSEWNDATGITIKDNTDRNAMEDNTAIIKAMYDNSNLYFAFDVTDTNLQATAQNEIDALHLDDSIEIFIDTLHNNGSTPQTDDYQFMINLNGAVVDVVFTGSGKDYSYTSNIVKSITLVGSKCDESDTDTGYIIEVAIPWSDIGVNTPGNTIGLNIAVNDRDSLNDGRQCFNWCDLTGSNNVPDNWGNAILEENSKPQINNPPVLSSIGNKSVSEGVTLEFTIEATDEDGDSLTYSAIDLPGGATFDTSLRVFAWTPVKGQAGLYTVTFEVDDGYLADSEVVTIIVNEFNDALNIAYGTVTIDGDLSEWNDATGITIKDNTDRNAMEDNTAIIKAMYDSSNLYFAFDVTDTNLQATAQNEIDALHLDDSIEIFIDTLHNNGSTPQTDDYQFMINLNGAVVDVIFTGSGKDYSYTSNIVKSITLVGSKCDESDTDTGYIIEVAIPWSDIGVNTPGNTIGLNIAVNDRDSLNDGRQCFNWCDLTGSNNVPDNWGNAILEENSTPQINNPPVLSSIGNKSVSEGVTLEFTIEATDEDGDSLTYSAIDLPGGATFDTSLRVFAWTPVKGQVGLYTVTFEVDDGYLSDSEVVTIIVNEFNDALNIAFGIVTIDGDLSEWNDATSITIKDNTDRNAMEDNTAIIKAMYDSSNLYFAFDVTDTNLQATAQNEIDALHLDDSIEIFIDTLHNNGSTPQTDDYQFMINLNGAVVDVIFTGSGKDYSYTSNIVKSITLVGSKCDESDTDTGYIIEVAIPWSDIGVNTPSNTIGLNMAVNDQDSVNDGRQSFNWCDLTGLNNVPDNWGDAIIRTYPLCDINEDGKVNKLDLTIACQNYDISVDKPYPRYDVNQDGIIDVLDLLIIVEHFDE